MHHAIGRLRRLMPFILTVTAISPAAAQVNGLGTLNVAAQVLTPLTITATQPLDFGRIYTATSKVIAPTDATSGRFELNGLAGSNISITVIMPSEVTMNGSTVMPLTGWKCVISNSPALTGTPVAFSPLVNVPMSATFQPGSGSVRMYIAFGATVQAVSGQANGSYSSSGQMAIAYTDL